MALLLLPLAVMLVTYHSVVNAWWMADDSMHLLSVARYGVVAHFVRPLVDMELIPSNLTPWLYASYGIDFALGGLNPRVAYVHHLISWSIALVMLALALRSWLGPVITAAVLVWFILAIPTSTVVLLLCTRHYVEGLLAATLCVLAYRAYLRDARAISLTLSVACYAWAITAKEVFVPLGPLLVIYHILFIDVAVTGPVSASFGSRFASRLWATGKALWPFLLLVAAYVLYRGYMLGFDRLLAGYDEPAWRTQPSMLFDFPGAWEWACRWQRWQSIVWLILIGGGIVVWFARTPQPRRRRGGVFALIVAFSILAPIYPVLALLSRHVNPHYLVIPLLGFFILAGWATREIALAWAENTVRSSSVPEAHARKWRINIALVSLLIWLAAGLHTTARHHAWPRESASQILQYRAEGEYELFSDDRALILDAVGPPWHHFGLQQLRRFVLHQPEGPSACVPGECIEASARQKALEGACLRYVSDPPRLENTRCANRDSREK